MSSLTVDLTALEKIMKRFDDPNIKMELQSIPQQKAVAAIISQAIADNFDKEGPGWAPLKPATIRNSVSKKLRNSIADMSDEELLAYEKKARKPGTAEAFAGPNRKILQKTRLLYGVATTPNASLSKNGVSGSNTVTFNGPQLVWKTDLVYAAVHNRGNPSKGIPKREFLTIREEWKKKLDDYILKEAFRIILARVRGNV